jgi:Tfp pilus assembly protein PilX
MRKLHLKQFSASRQGSASQGSAKWQGLPEKQNGAVLAVCMVFLLLLAMIGTIGMQTSTMELRMAGNEQARIEYVQVARSILDELKTDSSNFSLFGGDYYTFCDASSTVDTVNIYGCDDNSTLTMTETSFIPAGSAVNFRVTNMGQATGAGAISDSGGSGSSGIFQRRIYEVQATVDGTDTSTTNTRGSYASAAVGIMRLQVTDTSYE